MIYKNKISFKINSSLVITIFSILNFFKYFLKILIISIIKISSKNKVGKGIISAISI